MPANVSIDRSHTVYSFREIVETHKRAVYYLSLDLTGNHHDAEDLSQDVFIKAHKGLSSYRGDAQMYTWLRRIAINTYLNKKRKKAFSLMHLIGDNSESTKWATEDRSTDSKAEGVIKREHIERALEKLSPRERTAFVLRHHQEMNTNEVAEAMQVATGTVKSLLFRSIQKLRKELAFLNEERIEVQS